MKNLSSSGRLRRTLHCVRMRADWITCQASPLLPVLACSAAFAAILFIPDEAFGRPGGGHSFSGGRSGGGGGYGGGGSGDLGLVYLLIRLLFVYPQIGIPVLIAVVVWYLFTRKQRSRRDWATTEARPSSQTYYQPRPTQARQSPRRRLETLRRLDPDFSLVLFDDFLFALYAKAHEARGSGQLESLAAYLSQAARDSLGKQSSNLSQVRTVVIGAMTYVQAWGASENSDLVHVRVEFESNFTEVSKKGGGAQSERTYYVVEQWELARKPQTKSRPPDRIRVFGCPSCGSPLDALRGNTCSFCNNVVDTGEFDWVVTEVDLLNKEARGPQLTSDVQEEGTHLPTITSPGSSERLSALLHKDPSLTWPGLEKRIAHIFRVMQDAWSSRDWEKSRPYVSDNLFQTLLYWIETYRRERLRNVTENARIRAIELADVTQDRYFDAITVRLHATSLDYTISDDGKLVSGSRSRPRDYSEYWTLIRGTATRGESRDDAACPSCGAPAKVNMAGSCEYCSAKLSAGDFDWVLSRIEQDDAYQG